jgi:hypothetical protein
MSVSLIVLLWVCGAVASMAWPALLREDEREDDLHLSQLLIHVLVAPVSFLGGFFFFLCSWSGRWDVVLWKRKP